LVALGIPTINNRLSALVTGRLTENDGAGGLFFYDGSDATSTNLGTVFKPAASAGRWIRQYGGTINAKWFGVTGDGVTDDFLAITNAYDVAGSSTPKGALFFPNGTYLVSGTIVCDKAVSIYGETSEQTQFRKATTSAVFKIDTLGGAHTYSNFMVTSANNGTVNGGDTSDGIDIWAGSNIEMNNLFVLRQGGNGIRLRSGNLGSYRHLTCSLNTGNGILVDSGTGTGSGAANACFWSAISCGTNGGIGFNINAGDSHFVTSLHAETNVDVGFRVNDFANIINVYSENNTNGVAGSGGVLEAAAVGTLIQYTHGTGTDEVDDRGINNSIVYSRRPRNAKLWGVTGVNPVSPLSVLNLMNTTNVMLTLESTADSLIAGDIIGGLQFYSRDLSTHGTGYSGAVQSKSLDASGVNAYLSLQTRAAAASNTVENVRVDATGIEVYTGGVRTRGNYTAPEVGGISLGGSATFGGILTGDGFGGTYDLTMLNRTGSLVLGIPTGTFNVSIPNGGFLIGEGNNQRMGVATLVGGTIAVANTSVTANTRIFVSRSTTGGTVGHLSTTQIASTSFTVNSSSGTDTSTVNWLLIEPSP
jgi:hypothetical protein